MSDGADKNQVVIQQTYNLHKKIFNWEVEPKHVWIDKTSFDKIFSYILEIIQIFFYENQNLFCPLSQESLRCFCPKQLTKSTFVTRKKPQNITRKKRDNFQVKLYN